MAGPPVEEQVSSSLLIIIGVSWLQCFSMSIEAWTFSLGLYKDLLLSAPSSQCRFLVQAVV